jgi:hypothetical protein
MKDHRSGKAVQFFFLSVASVLLCSKRIFVACLDFGSLLRNRNALNIMNKQQDCGFHQHRKPLYKMEFTA